MTEIQKIFSLAGTDNRQDMLPIQHWSWPRGTWLQRRLAKITETCHCGEPASFQTTDGPICHAHYRMQVESTEKDSR